MKKIKVHSTSELQEKLQEWCDGNVYDDVNRKFREDNGLYKGFPARFIIHGSETVCVAYIEP